MKLSSVPRPNAGGRIARPDRDDGQAGPAPFGDALGELLTRGEGSGHGRDAHRAKARESAERRDAMAARREIAPASSAAAAAGGAIASVAAAVASQPTTARHVAPLASALARRPLPRPLPAALPGTPPAEPPGGAARPREAPRAAEDRQRTAAPERPPREHVTAPAPAAVYAATPPDHAPPPAAASAPAHGAPAPLPPPPPGHDVHGALLRSAAHLRVDAGGLGSLELHLRVRDGALHLRVDGDAAHLVEARAGELSRALSSEGLRLAPVEAPPRSQGSTLQPGSDHPREQRRDAWREAAEAHDAPRRPRAAPKVEPSSATARSRGGHIDVQA